MDYKFKFVKTLRKYSVSYYTGWSLKKREIQTVIYFLCFAAVSWYGKLELRVFEGYYPSHEGRKK